MVSMVGDAEKPTTISDIRGDAGPPIAVDLSTLPEVDPAFYTLGKEVARGGMGRVVEARDLRVGRSVVLKELLHETPAHAARFEREARVTARLQHPAIIPIYEIGKWPDGSPFYAMRMVEGGTLRAALAAAPTLESRLALLPSVISAAEAIAYAHSHRVIHRDLKPSNIMVGDFGETVVIDWGLAKDLSIDDDIAPDAGPFRGDTDGLTMVGSVVGTPAYMPPEQAAGEAVDERSDVYSLGAILYHLLAGTAPFKADTSEQLLALVKSQPPAPIANAPRDLLSIVDKAMARAPADRYANAGELVAELVRYRSGQLVGAHDYSRGELVRRWIRNHRLLVIAASAALVALAIAGTIGLFGIIRERDRADGQSTKATATTLALYEEEGRQELLRGETARALAYLDEAYKNGRDTPALRLLLAEALKGVVGKRVISCGGYTTDAAMSPSGDRVVVACANAKVFELASGKLVVDLHAVGATRVAFSNDGRSIAAAGTYLGVWDAASGKKRFEVALPNNNLFLEFTDDDLRLISLSSDGNLRIWSTVDGEVLLDRIVARLRVDRLFAARARDIVAVQSMTGNVELWDTRKLANVGAFSLGGNAARLSASGDGSAFVSCGELGVKVWAPTGRVLREIAPRFELATSCAISNDAKQIAVTGISSGAEVIDVSTGALMTVPIVSAMSVSYDRSGDHLLVRGPRGGVYDASSGSVEQELSLGGWGQTFANEDWVFGIDLGDLVVFPRVRPALTFSSPRHERSIGIAADGSLVATRSDAGTVTIWNTRTKQRIPHAPIHQHSKQGTFDAAFMEPDGVVFSKNGMRAAIRSDQEVFVLDTRTGAQLGAFPQSDQPAKLMLDNTGTRLAVGAPAAAIWDVDRHINLLADSRAKDVLALSGDGQRAVIEDANGVAIITPRANRRIALALKSGPFDADGFSSDGSRVVVSDQGGGNGRARTIICEATTGMTLAAFPNTGHGLSGSGKLLAVTLSGRLEVRRPSDGAVISSASHTTSNRWDGIMSVPNEDGTLLALTSLSSAVEIVDARTGLTLLAKGAAREPASMSTTGYDGPTPNPLWSGSDLIAISGGVTIWSLALEQRSPDVVDREIRSITPWRVVDGFLSVQWGTIRGRVTHLGHAVRDAHVDVRSAGWALPFTTTTDADGNYSIADIPDEAYFVTATSGSVASAEQSVVITFRAPTVVDFAIP